jgi:hypothetical protein
MHRSIFAPFHTGGARRAARPSGVRLSEAAGNRCFDRSSARCGTLSAVFEEAQLTAEGGAPDPCPRRLFGRPLGGGSSIEGAGAIWEVG